MTEKQENTDTTEKADKSASRSVSKLSVPIAVTIEDILRASKIVMDKGAKVRFGEISNMFGTKKGDQSTLSFALNGAVAFGILKPHSGRSPYELSDFGKSFLTSQEDQQKKALLPKFLGFQGYRDIIIGMRNSADKSAKKQIITDMWVNIIGGGKIATRQKYTATFASVGKWCGALDDTGQSCKLIEEAETIFSKLLSGGELNITPEKLAPPNYPTPPPLPSNSRPNNDNVNPLSVEIVECPICHKSDVIVNEKYLDKIPVKGGTLLIFERTYQCQGCSNKFIRTIRETVQGPD